MNKQGHPQKPISSLSVYKHVNKPLFAIIELAVRPKYGGCITQGQIHRYSEAEMQEKGIEIVKRHLDHFGRTGPTEPSEIDQMEKKEAQRFFREHYVIGIDLVEDKTWRMSPIKRRSNDRSAGIGAAEDMMSISPNCTNQEFYDALTSSFDKAS